MEDKENHKRIAPLLRFFSSQSNDELISLDEYVENMKPEQKDIYFIAADSLSSAKNAPFLEKLTEKEYEVRTEDILLLLQIDYWFFEYFLFSWLFLVLLYFVIESIHHSCQIVRWIMAGVVSGPDPHIVQLHAVFQRRRIVIP